MPSPTGAKKLQSLVNFTLITASPQGDYAGFSTWATLRAFTTFLDFKIPARRTGFRPCPHPNSVGAANPLSRASARRYLDSRTLRGNIGSSASFAGYGRRNHDRAPATASSRSRRARAAPRAGAARTGRAQPDQAGRPAGGRRRGGRRRPGLLGPPGLRGVRRDHRRGPPGGLLPRWVTAPGPRPAARPRPASPPCPRSTCPRRCRRASRSGRPPRRRRTGRRCRTRPG